MHPINQTPAVLTPTALTPDADTDAPRHSRGRGGPWRSILICSALAVTASMAHGFHMLRATVDGGGEMFCTGGAFELAGTLGQADAGLMTSGAFQLTGGFWFSIVAGDCDADGTINLVDFDSLVSCVTGPDEGHTPDCACYDLDGDGDIDLHDAAIFQRNFDGG